MVPYKRLPLKSAPYFWGIWTHSYQPELMPSNGISIGSAIFAQLTSATGDTGKLTDHNIPCAAILRFHLEVAYYHWPA